MKLSKLQTSVLNQIFGLNQWTITDDHVQTTLRDVVNHGAAGGVSGFIYYHERTKCLPELADN